MKQISDEKVENRIELILKWGLFFALILIVIPLLGISFYNFPFSDDFSYGFAAHEMILSGGNIFQVIGSAMKTTYDTYFTWQGSYFACFLMALNPAIWGENYYFLGTFFLLLTFVGSEILFIKEALELLSFDKNKIRIISYMIIITQILFVPNIVESFYWYNGAIYYTFFLSLSLFLGALLLIRRKKRIENKKTIKIDILSVLLIFLISGGNYSLALVLNIFLLAILLIKIIHTRKLPKFLFVIVLIGMFGLLISALAPGNQSRQTLVEGMGSIESIIQSFYFGGKFTLSWVHVYVIAIFLFLIPFIWTGLENTNFEFKWPGLVILFMEGMFCALFTPTLYGMASTGPPRLICMIYYLFYLIHIFNLIYLLGWMKKKKIAIFKKEKKIANWKIKLIWSFLCALLFVGSLGINGIKYTNPVLAALEIKNGNAEAFRQENLARFDLLKNPELYSVILNDFVVKPHVIYLSDLEDEDNYKNKALANYYHKESVKLKSYCE